MPPRRPSRPKTLDGFEIAIICALTLEADAVIALFDHHWDEDDGPSFGKTRGDPNAYSTGVIGRHNVVLAHLPGMGKVAAGNIAAFCRMSFPNINLALVVGICGGAPLYDKGQILLGDVIISTGVVQYDLGRRFSNKFEMKDTLSESLGRPNLEIGSLSSKLTTLRQIDRLQTSSRDYLNLLCQDSKRPVNYPGHAKDILFPADYRHKHQNPLICTTCASCHSDTDPVCHEATKAGCDKLGCDLRQRLPRHVEGVDKPCPTVHFGTFASGDTVMKSGRDRDQLTLKNKAIGFEMESVGAWEVFPCVVIKSVCDYADSHKNKDWQGYAAASAAACTKAFLGYWDSAAQDLQVEAEAKQLQERLLESLRFPEMNERRNAIAPETPSTSQWIFNDLSQSSADFDSTDDSGDSRDQTYISYDEMSDEGSSCANGELPDEMTTESSDEDPDQGPDRICDEASNIDSEEASDRSSGQDETSTLDGSSDEDDENSVPRRRVRRRYWDSFEHWLVSDQQTYWVSGKPGSGKSTLMKFLSSNPRTLESLGRWHEGTIILSHSFWKPGSVMQRSFKGLLCSLLYQLLDKDTNSFGLLRDMIATSHRASPSDWDQRELHNILYEYREQSLQPVCVFIDALDEAAPGQDTLDLLEFVKAFASPGIKICVSSRPEYFFQLHLREYPHLRMHELIKDDIVQHTMYSIRKSIILKPRHLDIADLASQIAISADGVFLWAILITRSLIRGINNGEPEHMIRQRLHSMPQDLMDLYRDVVLRSAEDRFIYQKYVSMALNLLFIPGRPTKASYHQLTVFEYMMAMDEELLDMYAVQGDQILPQDLQAKTETMKNLLDVGCDGFLRVTELGLGPVANAPVTFTHRAAHEFLSDTIEGRSLWNPCEISEEELWTRRFKAYLAMSRLGLTTKELTRSNDLDRLLGLLKTWQEMNVLNLELVASFLELTYISYGRGLLYERGHAEPPTPLILEIIQRFLEAGASMASKIPIMFRCYGSYPTVELKFKLPDRLATGPESGFMDDICVFFLEINASAMVDFIVTWAHQTFDHAFQLNFNGPKTHMKALAFKQLGEDTLFVVESESTSELLTETTKAAFFNYATTTHDANKSADKILERCRDIVDQLKPHCRPTKDPYFWKEHQLWPAAELGNSK
ncbi:hypothetical protein FSARC_2100 [Fusarium sarcochroum]|uniref:Nucleoside phosphorylase domain-containing protein n=1 Tax=Fusarium sarcochroum TaxID=1208366 RepID=A0A8H4XDE6_9HYPO|nr:hypothetical protein FSARC_2100 [Fusarium sarcochroum]